MKRAFRNIATGVLAAVSTVSLGGAALAQQSSVFIDQIGSGNTFRVDAADGTYGTQDAPLLQDGDGNTAQITTTDGTSGAAVLAPGEAAALDTLVDPGLSQIGNGNSAAINLSADDAQGSILQNGDFNDATLNVTTANSSGLIEQNGSNNLADVTVQSFANSSVTVRQNGSNLSTNGASVFTTAPSVTIIQTR